MPKSQKDIGGNLQNQGIAFILTFCLSPGLLAQNLTNGREIMGGEESRQVAPSSTDPRIVSPTSTSTGPVAPVAPSGPQGEYYGTQGQNLLNTGGYQVTQQSGLNNAGSTMSQGRNTQLMGLAMGGAFLSQCVRPFGQWACPLAAMSFMDAMAAGRARGDARFTAANLDGSYTGPGGGYTPGSDPLMDQASTGLQTLSGMGYTLNADGSVTGPGGAQFTGQDFANPQALIAKGMSPEMAAQAVQGMNEIRASAAESAGVPLDGEGGGQALAGGGGGAGGGFEMSGGGQPLGDVFVDEIEMRERGKGKEERLPASQAAKLSKSFNGTPIGIGMADLFLIVHKKYDEKRKSKTPEFFTGEYK